MANNRCDIGKERWERFTRFLKDIGKTDYFYASLQAPSFMGVADMERESEIIIQSLSVPSRSLNTHKQYYGNMKRIAPLRIEVDSCTVTFLDTKELRYHRAFSKWQDKIFGDNEDSTLLQYYPEDIIGELTIYNKEGVFLYAMEEVIPESIGDYRFDYQQDEIATFDVTFDVGRLKR